MLTSISQRLLSDILTVNNKVWFKISMLPSQLVKIKRWHDVTSEIIKLTLLVFEWTQCHVLYQKIFCDWHKSLSMQLL